ncbi:MAG: tetratricopeptide repeat protein [Planctomycetaceae bacterium]|nr:tetratricopeptide repeat protein [Planctomycetaceae bacterium]
MRRKLGFGSLTLVVALGLALWLWPRPARPHLLLVTLDTTRADRLSCYGYAAGRTPVLDQLAASGIVFERASTVAPCTLPAHASLFTGLYPAETGIRTNGRGRLGDAMPTLAAELKRRGYDTAAFVAALVLDSKYGLDQGFETYDDNFTSDDPHVMHRQRSGAEVVDAALTWLRLKRSKPFFCWVHLFDPHHPYLPHADLFGDEFSDRPYDAEIAYVDRQVGRLLEFLKKQGLDRQTLVVVVGDHGEGLGDHFERMHGLTLYDEVMHVPLIFRLPEQGTSGKRIAADISMVDVSPTVLDLMGLADRRQITGKSFKPAILGHELAGSPSYGATDEPFLVNGWSPLRSLTEGSWKYIKSTRPELYDLATDPGELHNLAAERVDTLHEMESRLTEFEARLVARSAPDVALTAAEIQALEGLGYAGAGRRAPTGPAPANLPDVKDMLPYDFAVEEALDLMRQGSPEEAIERLRDVVKKAPEFTKTYWFLAVALHNQSQVDEAMQVLLDLLQISPDSRQGHYGLGAMLLEQGRTDEATREFVKTIEIDPDYSEAHSKLAMLYQQAGETQKALDHLNELLQIDPRSISAVLRRASLLAELKRYSEAVADFHTALGFAPNAPGIHYNLAGVLAEQGQLDEAREHFERAVEFDPKTFEPQYALGALLVRQGRYADAIRHLTTALALKPGDAAAREQLEAARQALPRQSPADGQ